MVGAPDVDQRRAAAACLVEMVGDVAGEVGPAAVRFPQRPVDVVAELRGPEQGLRPRLPVLDGLALGRVENAGVEQAALVEHLEGCLDAAGFDQRALRTEAVEADAELLEV